MVHFVWRTVGTKFASNWRGSSKKKINLTRVLFKLTLFILLCMRVLISFIFSFFWNLPFLLSFHISNGIVVVGKVYSIKNRLKWNKVFLWSTHNVFRHFFHSIFSDWKKNPMVCIQQYRIKRTFKPLNCHLSLANWCLIADYTRQSFRAKFIRCCSTHLKNVSEREGENEWESELEKMKSKKIVKTERNTKRRDDWKWILVFAVCFIYQLKETKKKSK